MKVLKTLAIAVGFFISLSAFSAEYKKGIDIKVQLSPLGSFNITSGKIKGKVFITNAGDITAKNIRIPVRSLDTGIGLRNTHLKEKLGYEQNKKAQLLLVKASGKKFSGTALFKVLNKEQSVPFTFKKLNYRFAQAKFKLAMDKFKIAGIRYMGVGVKNIVTITITMEYKLKK